VLGGWLLLDCCCRQLLEDPVPLDAEACSVVLSGMRFLSLLRVRDHVDAPGPEMFCREGLTVSTLSPLFNLVKTKL
jgi:hypothetical protein